MEGSKILNLSRDPDHAHFCGSVCYALNNCTIEVCLINLSEDINFLIFQNWLRGLSHAPNVLHCDKVHSLSTTPILHQNSDGIGVNHSVAR